MKTFKSKVTEVKKLTEDAFMFTLTAPEDFSFEPGQFVTLMIKKNKKDEKNKEETKPRSYSILSAEKGRIKLAIKLIPGGFASEVFAKAKKGDSFDVKGPFGHFIFDNNVKNKEIWFLGGSTGVVPLYSMVKENLSKHLRNKFVLIFSARTRKDLFLDKEFKDLEKKFSNFEYIPTITREEWGEEIRRTGKTGRIPNHLPKDLKNKTFYICGTKELVIDVKKYLLDYDVNEKDIKVERFN